ncbi:MAG: hypothetical protein AAGF93_22970 [Cyanobacteria bacterium P01_H01_bin.105]
MDMVSFSTLSDDDQLRAIEALIHWVKSALAFHGLTEKDYCWSPAGDGGYITFDDKEACSKAIDVAFSIFEKLKNPGFQPQVGDRLLIRMSLHAGIVQEGNELGRERNIWGAGINETARIVNVSSPSQLLVSKQYFDLYIKGKREHDFCIGKSYHRTVKHGANVEIMNFNKGSLCISNQQAKLRRWEGIGSIWYQTIQEYTYLVYDAMNSNAPVAALAAAKFLLALNDEKEARELCDVISQSNDKAHAHYKACNHRLFSQMPSDVLFNVLQHAKPRMFSASSGNKIIFKLGEPSNSCFFPISGKMLLKIPGYDEPIFPKDIIGEFNLWLPKIKRTATFEVVNDGLLLEIQNDEFLKAIEGRSDVKQVIYGIIKGRIIENVLKSNILFPGKDFPGKILSKVASCKKIQPGKKLDLRSHVHIIFLGELIIEPRPNMKLKIIANGELDSVEVIGIISDLDPPDGDSAEVLSESVIISIPHQDIKLLQDSSRLIRRSWNGLCGERLGEIKRHQN